MTQFDLSSEVANRCLNVPLLSGYGNYCQQVVEKLSPLIWENLAIFKENNILDAQKFTDRKNPLHQAKVQAGYVATTEQQQEFNKLPYYGSCLQEHITGGTDNPNDSDEKQYGRIANPTVHIGLNQMRVVVNDIIRIYGKPDFVTLEFARDLKNTKKQKDKIQKRINENKKNNDKFKEIIESVGQKNNAYNRLLMRLWHELDWKNQNNRRCPYTGQQISLSSLFSDTVHIEHILPYSKTLDDSPANKTLSVGRANKDKGDRSPYEAFGDSLGEYNWDLILQRAQSLPAHKKWRFNKNAMERFKESGYLSERHLNDTRYLSKVGKKYLGLIVNPNNIHVVPGTLTAKMRDVWGVNQHLAQEFYDENTGEILPIKDKSPSHKPAYIKNRNDHRHHAVDACVIGCITRGMVNKIAKNSGRNTELGEQIMHGMPVPWDSFRDDVANSINEITVSYKPKRKKQGQLHEETFYGYVAPVLTDKGKETSKHTYVIRKPILGLKPKEIDGIRDEVLRKSVQVHLEQGGSLESFAEQTGIRHIRILVDKEKLIPLSNYHVIGGNNWGIDVYCDGTGKWAGEMISMFNAVKDNYQPEWQKNPNNIPIMQLNKNDLVAMNVAGERKIMRVQKIDSPSAIHFVENRQANVPSRSKELRANNFYVQSSVSSLQNNFQIRKVHISPAGLIHEHDLK